MNGMLVTAKMDDNSLESKKYWQATELFLEFD
jgi:hypothetical protein